MSEPTFGGPKRVSKNKKIALFAVGAGAGLLGILWWRNRQSQSSNSNSTDPNAVDPGTAYGTTPGYLGSYDPNTGTYGPGVGIPPVLNPTNATWMAEATNYLVNLGYNPVTVTTALGLYLAGQPLDQNEYDIVTAAIGAEGNPPNGAPPPVLAGGGGGTPGGATVTVPNVVNVIQTTAGLAVRARGLRFDPIHDGEGQLGTQWVVTSQSPIGGTKAKIGSTVTVHLHPRRAAKKPGRKSGPIRRGNVGINPGA